MALGGASAYGYSVRLFRADDNIARYGNMMGALGPERTHAAFARAINRTVQMMRTRVTRALVQQTSAPRSAVVAALTTRQAYPGGGSLQGEIVAKGKPLPLKLFKPKESGSGTVAKVWGGSRFYQGAFIKSGRPLKGGKADRGGLGHLGGRRVVLGGDVFHRSGKSRLPIEKMYGPAIPVEMVKDQSAWVFTAEAGPILERRVNHELGRLLKV